MRSFSDPDPPGSLGVPKKMKGKDRKKKWERKAKKKREKREKKGKKGGQERRKK